MKNLLFEELMIMSKTEKKAKKVSFSPSNNLVLGENDVGKSTLIKSLYHALGADTPQIDNSRWKKANPIYRVKISFDGKSFYIVRDEKYFGFFDASHSATISFTTSQFATFSAVVNIALFIITNRLCFHAITT